MANLAIPPSHRAALSELTALGEADIKAIAAHLDHVPTSIPAVAGVLDKYVRDSENAAEAIVSLSVVSTAWPMTKIDRSNAIERALGEQYGGTDIASLIDHPRVATVAKSVDLQSTYDRLLTQLRVVTDIRLVFPQVLTDDVSDVTTAVVANVLHLSFYENGRSHDISFAVKASDLNQFREQFDRAVQKNVLVRKYVEKTGVQVFNDDENDGK